PPPPCPSLFPYTTLFRSDDMLHPGYPTLITAVLDYLSRHPEMRVMCIVDRESITAAAKFLLCRIDAAARYEQNLMTSFARFHFRSEEHTSELQSRVDLVC